MADSPQHNSQRSSSPHHGQGRPQQDRRDNRRDNRGDNRSDSRSDSRGDSRGGGRRFGRRFQKRKVCRFTQEGVVYIDYKNYRLLRDFLTERGKIMPRRITGISAKHQRMLTQAIKRARHMALIPFVSE